MALDDRTAQEQLTPEERRSMLRAFADRMLLKISSMDDPEDMPGAERAVRVGAAIERIYSRCDRAEKHAPDPHKIEAERARNAADAIKARVQLSGTHAWGEERRKELGARWDTAGELIKCRVPTPRAVTPGVAKPDTQKPAKTQTPAPATAPAPALAPPPAATPTQTPAPAAPLPGLPTPPQSEALPPVQVSDYTDIIEKALASGLRLRRNAPHSASP